MLPGPKGQGGDDDYLEEDAPRRGTAEGGDDDYLEEDAPAVYRGW